MAETITAAGSATINLSELAVTMFVDTLPSRFNSVRTFIETHDPPLKYSEIRNYLVADDQRQAQRVDTTPFAGLVASDKCPHARKKSKCWTCNPELHPKLATCVDCHTKGHRSASSFHCPQKKKALLADDSMGASNGVPKPVFKEKYALMTANDLRHKLNASALKRKREQYELNRANDRYIMDSGCSQTILMNKDNLSNYIPCIST